MSLIVDLATYVAANSSLTLDTDLFVAEEPVNSPDSCVVFLTSSGSTDTESSLERRVIQVLAKAKSFIDSEILADSVYDLLKQKPGFDSLSKIFYCEVLNSPYPLNRDERSRFILVSNFLISKLP